MDVHISILQANASTRCAGINAASLALAQAGISMRELVSSVSVGKVDDKLMVDLSKDEEDYSEGEGSTDIPLAFTKSGNVALFQLDGNISPDKLKEAIKIGKKTYKDVYEVQKKALKDIGGEE